ncbi:MAG: ATP phosphoribosyltransferase regulatory subunit [Ferroplasma sp.]
MKIINRKLSEITKVIRNTFEENDFIEVFPPAFVKSSSINGFKFLYNNELYVLEPDITERFLAEKFRDNPKIYYITRDCNDSLNESLKAGAEYIIDDEINSNIEILKLIINILDNLGINRFNIDISLSNIFNKFKKLENGSGIISAMSSRNYLEVDNLDISNSTRNEIANIMNKRTYKSGIEKLDVIIEKINDERVIIDLGTVRQPAYYNGLIFEIYGTHEFIGGGGNYKIRNRNACGFSLNMEILYKLCEEVKK